jgi:hypothetical protein
MDAEIKLKNGNTLEIYRDEYAESPREWGNLSTFICFHKRYNLGDKHNIDHGDYSSWDEMEEENFSQDDIIVPLYMYDHSGISIATHPFMCRWDSGRIGMAVVTKQEIIESYGDDSLESRAKAKRCIEAEVEIYDNYVQGEVYGYVLKDSEGEEIDSCFGFYGYDPTTNGIFDNLDLGQEDVA